MINLIPTYLTENHLSFDLLDSNKDVLLEKGVELVQVDDFNFYLLKNGVSIEGSLGHHLEAVELFIMEPAFIGPILEVIKELFQVEYILEQNDED